MWRVEAKEVNVMRGVGAVIWAVEMPVLEEEELMVEVEGERGEEEEGWRAQATTQRATWLTGTMLMPLGMVGAAPSWTQPLRWRVRKSSVLVTGWEGGLVVSL